MSEQARTARRRRLGEAGRSPRDHRRRARRVGDQRGRPPPHLARAGLRQDVAEDLPIRLEGRRAPGRGHRGVEARLPHFWPKGNRFFAPLAGIAPGEVAVLDLTMPGGLKLSTGVLVLYADEESFTLMTPEGHMFAGWITFSAFDDGGVTAAQAHVLMRASDPLVRDGDDHRRAPPGGPPLGAHAPVAGGGASASRAR